MKPIHRFRSLALPVQISLVFALGGAASSFGQVAPAPSSTRAEEDESKPAEVVKLSAFTVTEQSDRGYSATQAIGATRTAQAIKDIAQTVLVVNQALLEDIGAGEQIEALKYISGVSQESNSGDNFTLRGYSLGSAYADGMPDNQRQQNVGSEPFMFERLEVFKGPSAIVYGSHSPGGVVNRVRKAADLSRPSGGTIGATLGNYGQMRADLDYMSRLGDNFAYRIVGIWRDEDLFKGTPVRFAYAKRWNLNPSIVWRINERAQLKMVGEIMWEDHFKHWGDAFALRPFGKDGPTTFSTGLLPRQWTISDSSGYNHNNKHGLTTSLELQPADRWSLRLLNTVSKWDHETNDWVPNGINADNRTMPRRHRLTINDDFLTATAIDTVFGFDTGPVKHQVVALAQYNRGHDEEVWVQDTNLLNIDVLAPNYYQSVTGGTGRFINPNPKLNVALDPAVIDTFITPRLDRANTSRSHLWSLSAQDQMKFFQDRLQVVGGVRYDNSAGQTDNRLTEVEGTNNRSSNLTYKFGTVFEVISGLNVYYNYSETFAPNFGTQPDGTTFKPREGIINEVGVKSSLWNGKLSGTLAVFKLEQTNLIQNDPDPLRAAAGWRVQSALNRVEGVEADIVVNPLPNWEIMLSGSSISIEQPNGLVPRGIPEKTAAFWTRYGFSQGRLQGLNLGGGVSWSGPAPLESGNNYFGKDVATGDVFASYRWKKYHFQLNLSNVTDEYYLFLGVNQTILYQAPARLIKFTVRYSF